MKYAVIQLGGKQFKIEEGDTLELEHQPSPLKIETLLYKDDSELLLGSPYVEDVQVKASVVVEKRGKKVRVARFKSKSRYRREAGHRQPLSVIKIESIQKESVKGNKPQTSATKKVIAKNTAVAKKPASKKKSETNKKSTKSKEARK